jgi:hypothetical protein
MVQTTRTAAVKTKNPKMTAAGHPPGNADSQPEAKHDSDKDRTQPHRAGNRTLGASSGRLGQGLRPSSRAITARSSLRGERWPLSSTLGVVSPSAGSPACLAAGMTESNSARGVSLDVPVQMTEHGSS